MKLKHSIFAAASLAVAATAAVALAGCGKTEEERFQSAKENFNNYTVEVNIVYENGNEYHSELQIADKAGKLTVTSEHEIVTYYLKEENATVYRYMGKNQGWRETSGKTIEESSEDYNGYVAIFQTVYYDDFEKDGDYLKLKDSALSAYSKKIGADIGSAKLILSGKTFTSAIVVVQMGSVRSEIRYTFKDYGKTTVTLPAE